MIKPTNIIVVGGNAAGPSAAAKARRVNPDARVIMFEASPYISTGTCELPYVLSGEIETYKDIVFFDQETFHREKGVEVFTNHLVTAIDRRKKNVVVKNLLDESYNEYNYDSLILCTGSKANKVSNFSHDLQNVFYLKNVSDLIHVKQFINSNNSKKCLIIGAGYIGLETADAILKLGMEVYLNDIHPNPFPEAEPEIQQLSFDRLLKCGAKFIPGSNGIKIFDDGERVSKIKYEGRLVEIDLVICAIGFSPNTSLAGTIGIELGTTGAIRVNRKLQTSDPSIYAAGDNIELINKITGRPVYLPLATLAHKAGHIAGSNAAGENNFISPVLKNIAIKFFDLCVAQVGFTFDEAIKYFDDVSFVSAVANNKVPVMPGSSKTFGKIVYRRNNKQIVGASFAGAQEVTSYADLVSSLIQTKTDAGVLAEITYNYNPPLSPFINILSILGRKIRKELS